jgi:hypothetical protein
MCAKAPLSGAGAFALPGHKLLAWPQTMRFAMRTLIT